MTRKLCALLAVTILVACATGTHFSKIPPPATEAKPVTETLHGVSVTDPYRWLEDQDAPATRDWIARENAYTDALIGNLPQKQGAADGGRYFFAKRPKGADQYAIYMR